MPDVSWRDLLGAARPRLFWQYRRGCRQGRLRRLVHLSGNLAVAFTAQDSDGSDDARGSARSVSRLGRKAQQSALLSGEFSINYLKHLNFVQGKRASKCRGLLAFLLIFPA